MSFADRIIFKRSFELLILIMTTGKYGLNRPDIQILDISGTTSPLIESMRRSGYKVYSTQLGEVPLASPDLILCYGPIVPDLEWGSVIEQSKPSTQLIIMNVPVSHSRRDQASEFELDPSHLGKFRKYPIHHWSDLMLGWGSYRRIRNCPVVKIRPIQMEFRLRQ